MSNSWTMEQAKNDFASVAEAAYAGRIQYIKDGFLPVLVISTQKDIKWHTNWPEDYPEIDFVDKFLAEAVKMISISSVLGRSTMTTRFAVSGGIIPLA